MSLKLFGCSFTNWIYPTWADFIKLHYDVEVKIYGRPAIGNDVLKRLLFTKTTDMDHVIVMFTGNDRLDHGIDINFDRNRMPHHIENKHWGNSFAFRDQIFTQLNNSGLDFKKHFSLFHALYKQTEVIVDLQNYAKANQIEYNFLAWQDLFCDLSYRRDYAGLGKQVDLSKYQKNPLFRQLFEMIDIDRFLDNPRIGLLNYVHKNSELFMYQNDWDFHPSCIAHFRYFQDFLKPCLDLKYRNLDNLNEIEELSLNFSKYYKDTNCFDDPFNAKTDNEFTHDKFYSIRKNIIDNFFETQKEKLKTGYHYE